MKKLVFRTKFRKIKKKNQLNLMIDGIRFVIRNIRNCILLKQK